MEPHKGRGRPRKPKPAPPRATPETEAPECPGLLGKIGRAEWRRVSALLAEMGTLCKIDRAALAAYCEAWEEFVTLSARARKEGPTVFTDKGNAVQNPTLSAKNRAAERLVRIAAHLGMTPAARTRLRAAENALEADALQDFLSRPAGKETECAAGDAE